MIMSKVSLFHVAKFQIHELRAQRLQCEILRVFKKKPKKVCANFVVRLEEKLHAGMRYVVRKEEMKSKFLSSQPINEIKS